MRLSDLHDFSKITIQCHDNPDADAIASGFAMYKYFQARGVDVSFIYGGRFPLQKSDLKLLVEKLGISVSYRNEVEGRISGLLLMVDCQYGTGKDNDGKDCDREVMYIYLLTLQMRPTWLDR